MSDATPPRRQPFGHGKIDGEKEQPQPAFEVVESAEFEVVEEAPKARPKKPRRDGTEPEPERPKKKKRKRSSIPDPIDEDQAARDRALRDFEWVWPSVLLGIGMILTFVSAFGATKLGALFTLGVLCLGLVITIPLTIAALMIIGLLLGIEYGRIGPAILKIAAITFVANGIMFLGAWMRLPGFIVFPISCFISFGLFMTQFDLDTWETNASVGLLNVLSFGAKFVLLGFLIVASGPDRGKDGDDHEDVTPSEEHHDKLNKRTKDRGDKLPGPANPGNTPPDESR